MPTYRPIPGQTDRQSAMPMNSPPTDDLTMMARERASNILMPYAQTGIPTPGSPGVNPTPGVTKPTPTAGVEDKLYQAVHPDTFSKVLEIIMQFVTGKPIPRQGGGPVEPGKEYTVGEEGPERFKPAVPGEIIPYGSSPTRGITYTAGESSPDFLPGIKYNPQVEQPNIWQRMFSGRGGEEWYPPWTAEAQPFGPVPYKPIPTKSTGPEGSPNLPIPYGQTIPPGGVAAPYTGPRPWHRPAITPSTTTPTTPPPTGEEGWKDYGEGIRYKLGPEDIRGDEMARQRILREARPMAPATTPEEQELAARRRWETSGYAEAHPKLIPGYQKSYYEAHPAERAAQEFYEMARGPQPGSYEYASEYMRDPNAAQKAASEREALATKGAADIYGKSLEYGIGTPSAQEKLASAQEKLAQAQYYREIPAAHLAGIRETNIAHIQGIRDQVAGNLEAAKIAAGPKDQILKGLETFLQKGSERAAMTGLPFDLQKEAADYITVMKDLGYISQEQYDKLPDTYKEKRWTEKSLRADLKKAGMKDKDIENYIKRAKAAGRI